MKTVSWHGNEEAISGIFLSNVSVFTPQFDKTGKWYYGSNGKWQTYSNFLKKCHKKKKIWWGFPINNCFPSSVTKFLIPLVF